MFIYYDVEDFTLNSCSKGYKLNNEYVDINTATAGEIVVEVISLNGISGDGNLIYLHFSTNANSIGTKYIDIAVGEAYGKDLQAVEISSQNCKVVVNEPQNTVKNVYFGSSSLGLDYFQNDTFKINYIYSSSYSFVSADFEVEYDNTKFELISCSLGENLTSASGAIYSVNDSISGYIKISYASLNNLQTYLNPVFTCEFKVLANITGKSNIVMKPTSIYDENFDLYTANEVVNEISLKIPTLHFQELEIKEKLGKKLT